MKLHTIFFTLFISVGVRAWPQHPDDSLSRRSTYFGFPIVYYTPETRWAFGGAGFASWRFPAEADTSRPSQVIPGVAYTLEDQILSYLSYRLWWNKERYTAFGEVGWYRYNYYFYGIGNEVPDENRELFGVNYPRLRITVQRKIAPHLFLGPSFSFDDFKMTSYSPDGQLIKGQIPGSRGGRDGGFGIAASYDSRDNIFESHSGWYALLEGHAFGSFAGGDFSYIRLKADLRKFVTLSAKDFLAFNFHSGFIRGTAPFMRLSMLGGNKQMRGIYEGRFRDDVALVFQTEYRRDLFGRFGAVFFGSAGAVGSSLNAIKSQKLQYAYGAGLR